MELRAASIAAFCDPGSAGDVAESNARTSSSVMSFCVSAFGSALGWEGVGNIGGSWGRLISGAVENGGIDGSGADRFFFGFGFDCDIEGFEELPDWSECR